MIKESVDVFADVFLELYSLATAFKIAGNARQAQPVSLLTTKKLVNNSVILSLYA
jgi:hypothetical protein